MLLPAGVTVNPVVNSPLSTQNLPYSFHAHSSVFDTTASGCRLQQLKDTRVTPGDPQTQQKSGSSPVALGEIHLVPVRPPIRFGPQGRMKGGSPCRRGAGSSLAGREMEGKAGLHPGGRTGGLWAPGAGHSNKSPLVCGTGVLVGGADPGLLLGGTGVYPQGPSLRTQRHQGCSLGGYARPIPVLTPPPGGLAPAPGPAPRALPPTPGPDVQLAEASAGGGVLRPQPALLPCQQLHCVREERAAAESGRASGGSASAVGRASERAGEGARRRPRLRSARLPATLLQRRTPCAPSCRRSSSRLAWLPWGRVGQGCLRWGPGHPQHSRGARSQLRRPQRGIPCRPNSVGRRTTRLRGSPRAARPDSPRGRTNPEGRTERACPRPRRPSRTPHFFTNFSAVLARGGRSER